MRPSNDEYFIGIAEAVSLRATCGRRKVGAVITDKDYQILSTGYNSVASGLPHCPNEKDCGGANQESGDTSKCIARHAEDVALMKCNDIYRIDTIYVTTQPCVSCVRRLLDTSCKTIVFCYPYPDTKGLDIWRDNGKTWRQI